MCRTIIYTFISKNDQKKKDKLYFLKLTPVNDIIIYQNLFLFTFYTLVTGILVRNLARDFIQKIVCSSN